MQCYEMITRRLPYSFRLSRDYRVFPRPYLNCTFSFHPQISSIHFFRGPVSFIHTCLFKIASSLSFRSTRPNRLLLYSLLHYMCPKHSICTIVSNSIIRPTDVTHPPQLSCSCDFRFYFLRNADPYTIVHIGLLYTTLLSH